MAMNKKAYFFSLTALLILALVYVYFSSYKDPFFFKESVVSEQRVQEVNRIVNLVEKDASVGLSIATFRALMDLEDNVSKSKSYINDFDNIAEELLLNGSINNAPQTFSDNNSLYDWQDNVVLLFDNMNAFAKFNNTFVKLNQSNPWFVTSYFSVDLFVYDNFTESNWSKKINVSTDVSILSFFDPLISKNTDIKRRIVRLPENIDVDNLAYIVDNGSYVASNNSPSYLQRFNPSNLNSNDYEGVGIESLIDKTNEFMPSRDRPIIDSLYFSNTDFNPCTAQGYLLATDYNDTYGVDCVASS